jgi:hypothetical protein
MDGFLKALELLKKIWVAAQLPAGYAVIQGLEGSGALQCLGSWIGEPLDSPIKNWSLYTAMMKATELWLSGNARQAKGENSVTSARYHNCAAALTGLPPKIGQFLAIVGAYAGQNEISVEISPAPGDRDATLMEFTVEDPEEFLGLLADLLPQAAAGREDGKITVVYFPDGEVPYYVRTKKPG